MSEAQELLPLRAQDIPCPNRAAWLQARRRVIGASESPAILNVGYANQSAWSIWHSKVSVDLVDDDTVTEADDEADEDADIDDGLLKKMRIGQRMEPVIRDLFLVETGVAMLPDIPNTVRVHSDPARRFIGASLDGIALHPDYGRICGELKNVSAANAHEWVNDEAPLKYEVQLQQQLAVTGFQWGVLVALIGGESLQLRWRERNERFLASLYEQLRRFWVFVETGITPVMDSSKITAKVLQRMHPDDNGSVVALPDEAVEWHLQRKLAKEAKKEAESAVTHYDNLLKQHIGDATYGLLADGSCYSWKTTERKGYVREVKPSKGRMLRDHKALPRGITYQPPAAVEVPQLSTVE